MTTFKHILIPTDFGEASEHALDTALAVARRFDAKVTLLHVYVIPVAAYSAGLYWPVEDLEKAARKAVRKAVISAAT